MKIARNFVVFASLGALALLPASASAELSAGTVAPKISTKGALAGKDFDFKLEKELTKGPVVLYFYPAAFTKGCSLEAQAFAAKMEEFKAAGAMVVGMSADDLPTLKRFSTEDCGSKFPVAMANEAVIEAYDVALKGTKLTNRTSYVIGQDGRIKLAFSDMKWDEHVSRTLAKVQELKGKS